MRKALSKKMAASSSDDSCSAPTEFDISSSLEESNGKYCFSCERCPLCLNSKSGYYCKYCIRNGDFVHSPYMNHKESFSEKKSKHLRFKREQLILISKVTTDLEEKAKAEKLQQQISDCREKIRLLKLSIADAKDETQRFKSGTLNNEKVIDERRSRMPMRTERIQRVLRYKDEYIKNISQRKEDLEAVKGKLKDFIRLSVQELVQLIFPISRVCFDEPQEDSMNQATISALAEATQTAFVSGRWVYTENSGNVYYRIVEPLLPANGDYSAYSDWVESNRDSVPNMCTEISDEHQAYGISAAFTYLCQLVSVLSYYLDIWLPHRLCYSEFCGHELNAQEFEGKVAKLNANVLHLCLLQNVNPEFLHSRHIAANLCLLLDPNASDLGRSGPIEITRNSFIQDLDVTIECDDDSEEEVENLGDWEKVEESPVISPRISSSTMPIVKQAKQHQVLPLEATTSATGGLMQSAAASIFSLWKAATGQK